MSLTKICRICGDEASGFNYQVLTCESCKVFFYRNAHRRENFFCRNGNGNCPMKIHNKKSNKRRCMKCRMEKCIQIGMTKEYSTNANVTKIESTKSTFSDSLCIDAQKSQQQENKDTHFGIDLILELNILKSLQNFSNEERIDDCKNVCSIQKRPKASGPALSQYEMVQINSEVQKLRAIFVEETKIKTIKEMQNFDGNFSNSYQLYVERIAKFCPTIEAYNQMNVNDRYQMFKSFCFSFLAIRCAFTFDVERNAFLVANNVTESWAWLHKFDYGQEEQLQSAFEFNRNCIISLHAEMDNDATIRDLLSLQLLFKPFKATSSAEYVRYHYMFYSRLLRRYLEHKYANRRIAARKLAILMSLVANFELVRDNEAQLLRASVDKIPHVFIEIYDLV